jgi:S-adenosylmethionine:tRNA ribosyltransferase-isomerase
MPAPGLRTRDLDYELPATLVATHPCEPRDAARMLVVRRGDDRVEHRHVRDLPEYLAAGDALVLNDTAVVPARLVGRRADSGGRVEGLFLAETAPGAWEVMLRSNGRLRPGHRVELDGGAALDLERRAAEGPAWTVRVEPAEPAAVVLERVGRTPLPPYIARARRVRHDDYDDERDRAWYQTVYAEMERRRSVAAPTAGLHFTPDLLGRVDATGARRHTVTLHVGPGTFQPVTADTLDGHVMHVERFEVPPETIAMLRERGSGDAGGRGRVLAIGTTTVRALESLPDPLPEASDVPDGGETDLLIAPPYRFRHVDGMLTNFHLPRSTLLALVAAMVGLERVHALYREAIDRGYRFYSYGDAMLVLP